MSASHSPLLMHVYTVYCGVFSAEPRLFVARVERETAQFYILNFDRSTEQSAYVAFGFRQRLPKDAAQRTPEGAWRVFVEQTRSEVGATKNRLDMLRNRLVLAEREFAKAEGK